MKNLLISFSGGETSAFMCKFLQETKKLNMRFVFANTSKENEETLIFIEYIDKKFKLNLTWVETTFNDKKHIGYKITNFKDAKRKGEVFESMIKCYGIPNKKYPHCTRELKSIPMEKFGNNCFGIGNYHKAIGIRSDEIDRISKNRKRDKLYYPFVEDVYITKAHVNVFFKDDPNRLQLKGYQGNCDKCWKKSFRKLMTIETENSDNWWINMEKEYGNYIPKHRKRKETNKQITFYRENKSGLDIREMSKENFVKATDDSIDYNVQASLFGTNIDEIDGCSESCEPFN